jgi:hypothetical protein
MVCKGLCDRETTATKDNGAYCSVCMRWLPFNGYGYKCPCCSQRLRLRNAGAQRILAIRGKEVIPVVR